MDKLAGAIRALALIGGEFLRDYLCNEWSSKEREWLLEVYRQRNNRDDAADRLVGVLVNRQR